MVKDSGSRDKYLEALDFIINVLKEHEQILDKSIHELATVTEQLENVDGLIDKVERVDETINTVQKEVTNIIGGLSIMPKEALQASVKEQESRAWATSALPSAVVQSRSSLILHCNKWEDFKVLAIQAQTLSFSIKEDEKNIQVNAIKGKQIVRYTGALPNFSIILKAWLSRGLDVPELNIVEGFLG